MSNITQRVRETDLQNTTTTNVNDTILSFSVSTGGVYCVQWNIFIGAAGLLPAYVWNLATTGATFSSVNILQEVFLLGGTLGPSAVFTSLNNNSTILNITNPSVLRVTGKFYNASGTDTVSFQFARTTGTSVTNTAGSSILIIYNL